MNLIQSTTVSVGAVDVTTTGRCTKCNSEYTVTGGRPKNGLCFHCTSWANQDGPWDSKTKMGIFACILVKGGTSKRRWKRIKNLMYNASFYMHREVEHKNEIVIIFFSQSSCKICMNLTFDYMKELAGGQLLPRDYDDIREFVLHIRRPRFGIIKLKS